MLRHIKKKISLGASDVNVWPHSVKGPAAYVCANKYIIGKPFARVGDVQGKESTTEGDGSSHLAEYEKDRLANMARNAAFMASLGLA